MQTQLDEIAKQFDAGNCAVMKRGLHPDDAVYVWCPDGWYETPFKTAGTTVLQVVQWLHSESGVVGRIAELNQDGSSTEYDVELDAYDIPTGVYVLPGTE